MTAAIQSTVATAYRDHYRAVVAPLIRVIGSFTEAEDVAQEAFAIALERWALDGVPDNPLAWLRRVARNTALDRVRRRKRWQEKEAQVAYLADLRESAVDAGVLPDDTLRLVFTCCHPALNPEAQIALTLRTVCGLTSGEVARAFLIKTTTLQQRLVRARRKIDHAGIPYVVPDADQLPARVSSVLRTVYLVFNEGYAARDGDVLVRRDLVDEAIRLVRLVIALLPDQGAPRALLALMLLQGSRLEARTGPDGEFVPLEEQDRSRWRRDWIDEALPMVDAALKARPVPAYAIEAAIAALHAQAGTAEDTDWHQIAALYGVLRSTRPDDVVLALNAAVAIAMAGNLERGIATIQTIQASGKLSDYHLLPAAMGDLLRRTGAAHEASEAYAEALALAKNPVERRYLERRIQECKQ